jgi:hypothetical protein
MPLNMGQIDTLLREILDNGVVYLEEFAMENEYDEEVVLNTLEDIKQLDRDLIIQRGNRDNITLTIPETERGRAEYILSEGGWGKAVWVPHMKKLEEEKAELKRRQAVEEHSWKAAARHARNANIIAWLALVVAAAAMCFEIFGKN